LEWEHAPAIGAPFSFEAAQHARRLPLRRDRFTDPVAALSDLLARWDKGMVADRRERRMAVRLSAERAALPGAVDPADQAATLPTMVTLGATREAGPPPLQPLLPGITPALGGDDDDDEEIFDDPDGGFCDDAFEVLS